MQNTYKTFAILGAGAWGTALACAISRAQDAVSLFSIEQNVVEEIRNHHTNGRYLKDIPLPGNIHPTNNLSDVINKEVIVIASPSHAFLEVINNLKKHGLSKNVILLIATKGLAGNPTRLFSNVLEEELPSNKVGFIAGPNFAHEVALGMHSLATIASKDPEIAKQLARNITSENFVIDTTDDVITLQLAGIIKNIVAIKSGINEASGAGENARAGLISGALNEIMLLSKAMGGKQEALRLPGVVGDLVLTTYSKTSRNMKFGYDLVHAKSQVEFLANYPKLVEGKESINTLIDLIKLYNIKLSELPIINSVYNSLKG
jgi:glycerol-3-phosphate dehydrogenase (NAD(P)+)